MNDNKVYAIHPDDLPIRFIMEDQDFALREKQRKKFHQELRNAFPILWRKHENDTDDSFSQEYDCFTQPSTDSGWNELIWKTSESLNNLIQEITAIFSRNDLPIAVQVKEKFGTLRFHCDGHWDLYPKEFNQNFHRIVSDSAYESEKICEECGKPGEIRINSPDDLKEKLTLIKCRCEHCWIVDAINLANFAHKNNRTKKGDKDFYAKKVEKLSQMLSILESK